MAHLPSLGSLIGAGPKVSASKKRKPKGRAPIGTDFRPGHGTIPDAKGIDNVLRKSGVTGAINKSIRAAKKVVR